MFRRSTSAFTALVALVALPSLPCAATRRLATAGAGSLIAGLNRVTGVSFRLFRFSVARRPAGGHAVLRREQGRQVLSFPIHEPVPRLYVHISGRVEFERADIGFADGTIESIDAFGVDRDSGLYELASYETARPVASVRLVLRARSRSARIGICLGA
jgi:hypothetical protein